MSEIIRTCKRHGDLNIDQVTTEVINGKNFYRCRFCKRENAIIRDKGISREKFDELHNKQQGKCAICNKYETRKTSGKELMRLTLDHCHKCTGHIRELLCHHCNSMLGKFEDNIEIMQSAIEYLKKHNE